MIGRCQYMTCGKMHGSSFRANFLVTEVGQIQAREVLICSECRLFTENARETGLLMCLTREGAVYLELWMDSAVNQGKIG